MPDGSGRVGVTERAATLISDPMYRAVLALGVTQIVSWGTTFYLLGGVGHDIEQNMGWSRSLVFAGMTVGLIAAGAASAYIGRLTDRHGARLIMTTGTVLAALSLVAIGLVSDPWAYLAGWIALGLAMRMTLYDAAFAALVQVTPSRGRLAISYLTLFGGFASTVFWPIGYWLATSLGWRETLFVFAAIQILLCLPLNWWGLGRADPPGTIAPQTERRSKSAALDGPILEGRERKIAMALFAGMISANSFVFGAFSAHPISILEAAGLTATTAVLLATLRGVGQVGGRTWEIFFAPPLSALTLGRLAIVLLPLSIAALIFGAGLFVSALLFTLLLGISNGLVTIVRGALPLALFGPEGYGALLGMLATPQLLMNAAAPLAYAALVDAGGPYAGLSALVVASLISLACMETLAWRARHCRPRP